MSRIKIAVFGAIAAIVSGQALAADLSYAERRRLDAQVYAGYGDYHPYPGPRYAAPSSAYARRGTTRICVDDADGVTCSYKNFTVR